MASRVFNNKLVHPGRIRHIRTGIGTNQIWEFTPGTNAWVQKASRPASSARLHTDDDHRQPNLHGWGSGYHGWRSYRHVQTHLVYNPVADTIGTIASHTATPQANTRALNFCDQMYVMGGAMLTPPNPSNEVDIYDPGS